MKNYDTLIWKRIYRSGKICSDDLVRILHVSNVHASRLIADFVKNHSNKVYKKGRFIVPFPQEKAPESVLNDSLLNSISVATNEPLKSGLFDKELYIVKSSISNHRKMDDFLITIIQAIGKQQCIEAVYVSLTYKNSIDDKEKPRIFYPVGFKFFDGFWYLLAVELKENKKDIQLKMYSLSRFQHIAFSDKKYKGEKIDLTKKLRFTLTFNSAFTQEQKNIIIDELGLHIFDNNQYYIDIFEHEKLSFKRKYFSDEKPSVDSKSIYPFFTSYTEQSI